MRNVRDTTCSRCGKSVPAAARFCMECGSDLTAGALGLAEEKTQVDQHVSDRALLETLRHVTLGEYEVVAEVGRGGMATVFLAHDIALDRKVAIKVISPELLRIGDNVAERFQREARTAASLSHPHIIPIYAVKKSDRLLFFIMKFVEGRTLESVLREEKQLPIPMVQTIVNQVGSALDYAHRNGVIHRDIKPGNIMLDEGGWAVVTDFGIAKVTESDGLTITGATIGTPTYMSPEQCAGAKLTGATDQYALGVVTFEMLTGTLPFEGESAMTVMYKHTHEPPPVIFDIWPDCPRPLGLAVMRMLAKVPGDRFPSLEAAMDAIGMADRIDGEMRTRMVSLAKSGGNRALLERFKTPQSAVPRRGVFKTRPTPTASKAPEDAITAESMVGPPTPAPPGKRRSGLLWWLLGAVVVGGGAGAVAVMLRDPIEPPTVVIAPPPAPVPVVPTVADLAVSPEFAELTPGETLRLQASASDSAGNQLSNVDVTFQSRDPAIADVTSDGLVSARAAGTVQIVARSGGHSVTIGVSVSEPERPAPPVSAQRPPPPARVASVSVTPDQASVLVGEEVRLQASALDGRGRALSGRTITWASSNTSVATVSGGVVTGRSEGSATIRATSEGESEAVMVTVRPIPVASVATSPATVSVQVGQSATVSAQGRDASGRPLDRPVEWRSSNPGVATVSSAGVIRGVAAGTTTILAAVDGRTANVAVTVTAPAPVVTTPDRMDPAVARQAIERIIQAYASAIQARDISEIQRLYPNISAEQEEAFRSFFREVRELAVSAQVAQLNVSDVSANASIDMVYEYRIDRAQRQGFSIDATFRRQGSEWQLVNIRDDR